MPPSPPLPLPPYSTLESASSCLGPKPWLLQSQQQLQTATAATAVTQFWEAMLCEAACSSESRQLDLQIPVVGDSAMLLEYMTSCAQLCGEPGCDIRAHLDMLEEGAHVIRLQVRVSYERTVEATMQQQLAQLQTPTPASLASTELALTDLGEERHKEALEKVSPLSPLWHPPSP